MPEPHAIYDYRGYQLIEWRKGGSIEIWHHGTYIDGGMGYPAAQATVNDWLDAR